MIFKELHSSRVFSKITVSSKVFPGVVVVDGALTFLVESGVFGRGRIPLLVRKIVKIVAFCSIQVINNFE